ncbi:MAG: sphingomyelin phosphodiesterase [Cyclobacteriaceae bacterium]|nr:sphingomyelin phosphodiesterase [Cyclobacteriaceae bacterium]
MTELCSGQDSVTVLSWNIQMLPIIKSNSKVIRARAIVEQLNQRNYDVIVFQEMFQKRSRRIITKGLAKKYPHHTPVLNKKFIGLKTNGGVMLFSKYPIRDYHQIRFSSRSGIDKMSRKGAMMAEIDVNGKIIQVVGTHLQAFGAQNIMYDQYMQLASELLDPHTKEGIPQLICGDLNTIKSLPPQLPADISQSFVDRLPRYSTMLEKFKAIDGDLEGEQQYTMDRPINDLCITRKEYRLLLDYILLRPNGLTNISINRRVQIIRQRWSPEHEDLSDHFRTDGYTEI